MTPFLPARGQYDHVTWPQRGRSHWRRRWVGSPAQRSYRPLETPRLSSVRQNVNTCTQTWSLTRLQVYMYVTQIHRSNVHRLDRRYIIFHHNPLGQFNSFNIRNHLQHLLNFWKQFLALKIIIIDYQKSLQYFICILNQSYGEVYKTAYVKIRKLQHIYSISRG